LAWETVEEYRHVGDSVYESFPITKPIQKRGHTRGAEVRLEPTASLAYVCARCGVVYAEVNGE
jgi:hypothetical protein